MRRWSVHSLAGVKTSHPAAALLQRGSSPQVLEMHETWATRNRALSDALRSCRASTCWSVRAHEWAGRTLASREREGETSSLAERGAIRRLSCALGVSGS
eukprot:scaffold87602_cov27-Tisochrysis_lutea.AAC.5